MRNSGSHLKCSWKPPYRAQQSRFCWYFRSCWPWEQLSAVCTGASIVATTLCICPQATVPSLCLSCPWLSHARGRWSLKPYCDRVQPLILFECRCCQYHINRSAMSCLSHRQRLPYQSSTCSLVADARWLRGFAFWACLILAIQICISLGYSPRHPDQECCIASAPPLQALVLPNSHYVMCKSLL